MHGTSTSRHWALLGAAAALIVALGTAQAAAVRRAPAEQPSLPKAVVTDISSQTPAVSGDGRLVVYAGVPATADDPRTSTIWLDDRADGSVVELTAQPSDIRSGNSLWPVLSADGCSVTVITELAFDLFRDDDEGTRWDVYRQVLPSCGGTPGSWQLVSASRGSGFDASAGDDVSPLYPPAVSGDGTQIAYTHQFSSVAPAISGVTVVDLSIPIGDPGRSLPVAGTPAAAPDSTFLYVGLREPAISADGATLAYTSDADSSTALADWGTGPVAGGYATSQVFVWDRSNLDRNTAVRRISSSTNGGDGSASSPTVSGDGQFVAFVSTATTLVAGAQLPVCNPDCTPQVYLFDRATGVLTLASRVAGAAGAPPVAADAAATQPVLDHNGDELLYVTRATNLSRTRSSGAGGPTDGDIMLFVPSTGAVQRVSVLADGVTPAPAANAHPKVSATGRVVVFDTLAGVAFGSPAGSGRQVAIVDHAPVLGLADLDVGTVAVGFPGPEWFLVLNNQGLSSFVPAAVEVSNPDFLISGGSCADGSNTPVPPGGSCTVTLMMMPTVAGDLTGTLTVREDGFGAASITSQLSGSGGDPALAAAPGGAFGGSLVVGGRGEPMLFSLYNVAFNPVKLGRLTVAGSHPDDFEIILDACSGSSIDAGEACGLQVLFTPSAAGRRTAQVVAVTTDGVYATILLSGDARYEPKLAVGNTTARPGSRLTVAGAGFSPNTVVTINWSDGSGRPLTAVTDAAGSLLAELVIRPGERPGARSLVAQTTDGQVAAADVQVANSAQSRGPSSPNWPGR
jgi:hypothetical protein